AGTRGEDTMASVTAAPTADPTPPPPPPKIAAQAAFADDLPALVDRARALLADPALDVTAFERFLNPVIELYVSRFHRLPLHTDELPHQLGRSHHTPAELRAWGGAFEAHFEQRFGEALRKDEARAAAQEQQEKVLKEYREV